MGTVTLIILASVAAAMLMAVGLGGFIKAAAKTSRPEKMFEQYRHHDALVWVRKDLRGLHRDNCLCFDCKRFHPGSASNCPIANAVYKNCVECDIVSPVWECPRFKQDPYAADR